MNTNDPGRSPRLDHLDAVRAFALVLGIVFHASISFTPIFMGWAVMDISTSPLVSSFIVTSHSFRMELFFLIAGFFSYQSFHAIGAREFLAGRFMRVVVPFLIGWFLLRPLIISGWTMGSASLRGEVDVWVGLKAGVAELAGLPRNLFTGTHLWFLYYLALVTSAVLLLRAAAGGVGLRSPRIMQGVDAAFARLLASRFLLVALALPTAGVLWFMTYWGVDTPDRTLVPNIPVLLLYGGFFIFGWRVRRNASLVEGISRLSVGLGCMAAASLAAVLLLVGLQADTGHPHFLLAHAAFAVSYGLLMWSLVFLTLGFFRKICRSANPFIRYLADASYWLYLVHLPLVVWLQVAVAELPLHWSIKLPVVVAGTLLVALVSYDIFVRPTLIGQVLNGRRRPRVLLPVPLTSPASLAPSAPASVGKPF
jgi:peptidoglycan/LPS O-acetylase OafA/YrhL